MTLNIGFLIVDHSDGIMDSQSCRGTETIPCKTQVGTMNIDTPLRLMN